MGGGAYRKHALFLKTVVIITEAVMAIETGHRPARATHANAAALLANFVSIASGRTTGA